MAVYPMRAHVTSKDELRAALSQTRDLSGANMSGLDLSKMRLAGHKMVGADLQRANLSGAALAGIDMTGADLREAQMAGVRMAGVNLQRANLTGADMSGARLAGVNVKGANLSDVVTTGARAIGVKWEDAWVPPSELPVTGPPLPIFLQILMNVAFILAVAYLIRRWRRRRKEQIQAPPAARPATF